MSKNWSRGSTKGWRRIRAQVLLRDHHRCQLQIRGTCTATADQVHHTLGRDQTGDDPAYLVAACRACNLKIGHPGSKQPQPKKISSW